jgi:hypothetical protein
VTLELTLSYGDVVVHQRGVQWPSRVAGGRNEGSVGQ